MNRRQEYRVGDALDVLEDIPDDSAGVVHLDDAWSRPKRAGAFGVEYPTHDLKTTHELIDAAKRILKPGGWLIADADDWLLPELLDYLRENWGNAAETYREGYRKVGGVHYQKDDGSPDCGGSGKFGRNGGYPVVFAHHGQTDRATTESVRQPATRQREQYGWGTVKPIAPYKAWISGFLQPDELLVVPCAGTAPAAISAELVHGDRARYLAIDSEAEARTAFHERRGDVLNNHGCGETPTLEAFGVSGGES